MRAWRVIYCLLVIFVYELRKIPRGCDHCIIWVSDGRKGKVSHAVSARTSTSKKVLTYAAVSLGRIYINSVPCSWCIYQEVNGLPLNSYIGNPRPHTQHSI